jgi:hypothetical protein
MAFDHYDEVPAQLSEKIIEKAKAESAGHDDREE